MSVERESRTALRFDAKLVTQSQRMALVSPKIANIAPGQTALPGRLDKFSPFLSKLAKTMFPFWSTPVVFGPAWLDARTA